MILGRYQERAPVDVEALAADFEIGLLRDHELGKDVSGKLVRDSRLGGPSGYVIVVNGKDNRRRQRFTIAHEIGHYVLHRDLIGEGIVDDALYRGRKFNADHRDFDMGLERQANRFAADLLLPASLVRERHRQMPSPARLAEEFDVSEQAMRIRLEELGCTG